MSFRGEVAKVWQDLSQNTGEGTLCGIARWVETPETSHWRGSRTGYVKRSTADGRTLPL